MLQAAVSVTWLAANPPRKRCGRQRRQARFTGSPRGLIAASNRTGDDSLPKFADLHNQSATAVMAAAIAAREPAIFHSVDLISFAAPTRATLAACSSPQSRRATRIRSFGSLDTNHSNLRATCDAQLLGVMSPRRASQFGSPILASASFLSV